MSSTASTATITASTRRLSRRDLFTSAGGGTFRLLDVYQSITGERFAHVLGMDDKKALPKQWRLDELEEGLDSGLYKKLAHRGMRVDTRAHSDAASGTGTKTPAEVLRDWRYALIKPLVRNELIYFRKHRGQLVADRAEEMDASEQTIMTCLRLYWRGGMTSDALLGDFANCGKPKDPSAAAKQATRGRTPRRGRYEKYQWSGPDEKKKVLRTALKFFSKRKTNTRHFIYRRVVAVHYCTVDANGKLVPLPLGQRPTAAQVLYLLDQDLTLEKALRRSMGDDNFENNKAPLTGSAREYAGYIGHYYELDATVPDVWICAQDDRTIVIGKATLYIIIDVFSQLIVGFHLSLDAPSWSVAKESVVSIFEDKRQLSERWGLAYESHRWPAHGYLPSFIRVDRGPELIGYDSDSIADGLECGVINVPARKGPRKGTIECSFKLITVSLKDHVGGHTPSSDIGKRQTDDYKGEACRTLTEVGQEILEAIHLRNSLANKRLELPARDIYKQEQPIPLRMWERDFQERAGMLSQYDPDYVRFKLLPTDIFTVTASGIFFRGLLWIPPPAEKMKWLLPANNGVYKVSASFRRDLVDCIWVHDPTDPSKWTEMQLSDRCLDHLGKTFAEVAHSKDAKLTLDELASEYNLAVHIQHDQAARAREAAAQQKTKAAIAASGGRSRTNGAQEKRAVEARANRQKQPALTAASTALPPQPPSSTPTAAATAGSGRLATSATNQSLQALLNLRKKQ